MDNEIMTVISESSKHVALNNARIQEYLSQGYYVVVKYEEIRHPVSGAYITSIRCYEGHFFTEQQAQAYAMSIKSGLLDTFYIVPEPGMPKPGSMVMGNGLNPRPTDAIKGTGLKPLPKSGNYHQWYELGKGDRRILNSPRSKVKPYLDGFYSN